MVKQLHVYVYGDVIGVGFRAWTKIQTLPLHITGWIRNVHTQPERFGDSGGVEMVIQGQEDQLSNLLSLLKEGSPISHVQNVEYVSEEVKDIYQTFEIVK